MDGGVEAKAMSGKGEEGRRPGELELKKRALGIHRRSPRYKHLSHTHYSSQMTKDPSSICYKRDEGSASQVNSKG